MTKLTLVETNERLKTSAMVEATRWSLMCRWIGQECIDGLWMAGWKLIRGSWEFAGEVVGGMCW